MSKYDVVVIGAGAAGLSAAGLLAKHDKSVLLVERAPWLGGRGMMVPDEDFRVQIGAHLLEDTGSGIMKIAEYLGTKIEIGPISSDMAVWDHEIEAWGSIRDRYARSNRQELKKVINALVDTPYEELDNWDDKPLRAWLFQHTDDQGVVDLFEFLAVLECMTDNWYDHSASDNLYVRKLHYQEARKGGFSFWPVGGWDGLWDGFADALTRHGGEYRLNTSVSRVVVENDQVKGVLIPREPRILPNEIFEEEFVEADCVISTLPVWSVLNVVPEEKLPDWYVAQIKHLAQDKFRVSWVGLHIATEEPCPAIDRMELCTWLHAPESRLSGFMFEQTAMDPDTAPSGVHLYTMGGVIDSSMGRDQSYLREMFAKFERDMVRMFPCFENAVWRRRHLVFDPAFGVISKPYLVGQYRPHWRAPNVDGLYFASETFKSRMIGTDRAARAALTIVEDYLGKRLWPIEDSWRY